MAKSWRAGRLATLSLDEYTQTAGEMVRHTPTDIVYHRISASARKPTLLAPNWCENHWVGMNNLYQYFLKWGGQGSAL